MDGCILLTPPTELVYFPPTLSGAGLAGPQSPTAPWWRPRALGLPVPMDTFLPELTWEAGPPICTPIPWARLCTAHLKQALSLLPLQVTTAAWEASHGEHLAISSGEPLTVTLEDACCSSGLVLGPQAQIRHMIPSTTCHLVRNDLWDLADSSQKIWP